MGKHLTYESDHRDDRQYVAKYNGGYTQHVRKEVKYLDGDGLQRRCAEDFVQAWKNLVGMTDKGEKRFEICQHDEERKFVNKSGHVSKPRPRPRHRPCHRRNPRLLCATSTTVRAGRAKTGANATRMKMKISMLHRMDVVMMVKTPAFASTTKTKTVTNFVMS